MELTINTTLKFKTTDCITCGVHIVLEEAFYTQRKNDHVNFYCPNGHGQHFAAETEAERLRKALRMAELAREKAEKERAAAWAGEQAALRAKAKTEAENKRKARRTAAGVCTCCNRTFKQLAAHMKSQHPEKVNEALQDHQPR